MGNVVRPDEAQEKTLKENYVQNCQDAAKAIFEADYFLFTTGAGWSADSGLAVYKDVANVPPYTKRKLTYADICQPSWITKEPELFYGFWGSCFNDYRRVEPHQGYKIINSWKETYFSDPKLKKEIQDAFLKTGGQELIDEAKEMIATKRTLAVLDDLLPENIPGQFFNLTSNVDAHSLKSGLKRTEVYEIHGNIEGWHCSRDGCQQKIWPIPGNYKFIVDPNTMLTPSPPKDEIAKVGFESTFPRCFDCLNLARPSILMFGDCSWCEDKVPSLYYKQWKSIIRDNLNLNRKRKLVIVEIGCGNRVTSIRNDSEAWANFPGEVTMVRINPEFPLPDRSGINGRFISIMGNGLESVKVIDECLKGLKSEKMEKVVEGIGKLEIQETEPPK